VRDRTNIKEQKRQPLGGAYMSIRSQKQNNVGNNKGKQELYREAARSSFSGYKRWGHYRLHTTHRQKTHTHTSQTATHLVAEQRPLCSQQKSRQQPQARDVGAACHLRDGSSWLRDPWVLPCLAIRSRRSCSQRQKD
jgi:hypothetical protein